MNESTDRFRHWARWTPWIVGASSFLIYALTMVRDVIPGTPVQILNTVNGLYYLPVMPHYLYSSLAKLVVGVFPGTALFKLNLLSALCGALSLVLFYHLLLKMPMFVVHDKASPIPRSTPQTAKFITVIASILFVIFCVPFWLASTRPDNLTFDLLVLLSCFWMVLRYARLDASLRWVLASAFLYGLGITEYATMIALGPVFVISVLLALLYRHELNATRIWQLIALGFCGLLFYLAPVWAVSRIPDWGYQEYTGFWNTLLDLWRKQYMELKASFPRVGGLLIILCAFAPWVYVYLVPRPSHGSSWIAHALTVVALAVLNVLGVIQLLEKGLTPTRIMGPGALFLLPYLAIGSWMGYLAGYWWYRGSIPSRTTLIRWQKAFWKSAAVLTLLLPIGIGALNYIRFTPSKISGFTRLARNMIRSCQDRPIFIISKSIFDDLIRYAAFEQGQPKHVIISQDVNRPSYRRYLARVFPILNTAQTSIDGTAVAVLKSIAKDNPNGPAGCSLLNPEMALFLGFQFVPNGLIVFPVENLKSQNAREIYERNMDLFENLFAEQIRTAEPAPGTTNALNIFICQNYSRSANNLGVAMQLFGSDDLAESAYDLALKISPQNPSALLNQRAIYLKQADGSPADDPKAVELTAKAQALLDRAEKEASQSPRLFRTPFLMAANYGHLYSEQFALTLADESRRSGNHDFESGAIEQARQMNPESIAVKISSALFAMGKGDPAEAEVEYQKVLQSQPNNLAARIGLAVIARDRQDYPGAIRILGENSAVAANVNAQSLLALLYMESRETERGESLYSQVLNATNHTTLSASFVALSAWQLSHVDRAESFAKKVLAVDPQNQPMLRLMASIAQKRGDPALALNYLQAVQRMTPQDIPLQEMVIRLALQLKHNTEAQKDAETLIEMDPDNMIGNMAMATLSETPEVRETHLRRCLANRDHPLYSTAVNNLAYNLIQMNRCAEALPLAEEAVNLLPSDDKCHHTLAEAYKGLGRYDKALEQILLASTIAPDDANHTLVQGEILIAQGDTKKGHGLVVKALPNLSGEWRKRALKILKK